MNTGLNQAAANNSFKPTNNRCAVICGLTPTLGLKMREFEPVLQLDDWYDGPRAGIALYQGVPHSFRSRMLDVHEYRGDFESSDIFELVAEGAEPQTPALLASATFRKALAESASGWEVSWAPLGLPSA